MKIETIYFMERLNTGNYCHIEASATAKVEDGDDVLAAMLSLKTFVKAALTSQQLESPSEPIKAQPVEQEKVEPKEPTKEKKTKATRPKVESMEAVVTPVKEEKPPKNIVIYNSNLQEHKAIFGAFLNSKYKETWKTAKPKEEIQAFTKSLNGDHFLDDNGQITEAFIAKVEGFFGA